MFIIEKRFETDIKAFFIFHEGGFAKGTDSYDAKLGLYPDVLLCFVNKEWTKF